MQMAKIHTPHRKSGYLAGIEFEATTDREGRPDWTMVYEPGPKAKAEHQAFTTRGGPVALRLEPPPAPPEPLLPAEAPPTAVAPEPTGLAAELVARSVSRAVAAELARDFPEERIRRQIEVLDWLREQRPKKVKDLGAYLADAIRKDFAAPAGFEGQAERAARETAARAAIEREAETRRSKAREREAETQVQAYWENLPPERRAVLEAEALAECRPCRPRGVRGGDGARPPAAPGRPARRPPPAPARLARGGLTGRGPGGPPRRRCGPGRRILRPKAREAHHGAPGRFWERGPCDLSPQPKLAAYVRLVVLDAIRKDILKETKS